MVEKKKPYQFGEIIDLDEAFRMQPLEIQHPVTWAEFNQDIDLQDQHGSYENYIKYQTAIQLKEVVEELRNITKRSTNS